MREVIVLAPDLMGNRSFLQSTTMLAIALYVFYHMVEVHFL